MLKFDEICRICLATSRPSDRTSVFERSNEAESPDIICNKIFTLTDVKMSEDDGLPNSICDCCLLQVEEFFAFRMKVQHSDLFLKSQLLCNTNNHVQYKKRIFESVTSNVVPVIEKQKEEIKEEVLIIEDETEVTEEVETVYIKKGFMCGICKKNFSISSNLKRHIKIHNTENYSCDSCDFSTFRLDNLKRHKEKHKNSPSVKHSLLQCPLCDFNCKYRNTILEHLVFKHNINTGNEVLTFANEQEFSDWKKIVEKNEKCFFTRTRGNRIVKQDNCVIASFKCFRDGLFSSRAVKRNIKLSNRINGFCPASIDAHIFPSGKVEVKYCRTHVGHKKVLGRLTLNNNKRNDVERKLPSKMFSERKLVFRSQGLEPQEKTKNLNLNPGKPKFKSKLKGRQNTQNDKTKTSPLECRTIIINQGKLSPDVKLQILKRAKVGYSTKCLAALFGCEKTDIEEVLANKDKILEWEEGLVNQMLYREIQKLRSKDGVITDQLVMQKAKEISGSIGSFKIDDVWLDRFKIKYLVIL
uniref:HTH CENPB-type domain-containing protein n=1 Tax=Clastoptera arizonana TaxID=38151 RepID=A0A1B6DM21_9HEMI